MATYFLNNETFCWTKLFPGDVIIMHADYKRFIDATTNASVVLSHCTMLVLAIQDAGARGFFITFLCKTHKNPMDIFTIFTIRKTAIRR